MEEKRQPEVLIFYGEFSETSVICRPGRAGSSQSCRPVMLATGRDNTLDVLVNERWGMECDCVLMCIDPYARLFPPHRHGLEFNQ
jgi:hypothetical protein